MSINIGDKVRFIDSDNPNWVGQEGVVICAPTDQAGLLEYRITKITDSNLPTVFNTVGNNVWVRTDQVTVLHETPKFRVGDKVNFNYNEYWDDGEAVIESIVHTKQKYYNVRLRLTKQPSKNKLYNIGDLMNWNENEIVKIKAPEPLNAHDLIKVKTLGHVVKDTQGRLWVGVGNQTYVHKSWDGIQALAAASLVKNYSPITEGEEA